MGSEGQTIPQAISKWTKTSTTIFSEASKSLKEKNMDERPSLHR